MSVGSDNWNGEMLESQVIRGGSHRPGYIYILVWLCLLGNWIIIHRDVFSLKEIFHQRTCSHLIYIYKSRPLEFIFLYKSLPPTSRPGRHSSSRVSKFADDKLRREGGDNVAVVVVGARHLASLYSGWQKLDRATQTKSRWRETSLPSLALLPATAILWSEREREISHP